MKILLLSDPGSPHTIKWAKALAARGINIFILGLSAYDKDIYSGYSGIHIHSSFIEKDMFKKKGGDFSKSIYLKVLPELKKIIEEFSPDIIHAHYATSYGLLGVLSGFHPLIISLWGSDIYDFPNRSFFHRFILKRNLSKADKVLSTSCTMANEAKKYYSEEIEVIPFGIDMDLFKPAKNKFMFKENEIVVGTIKTLEAKYGIDTLIKAFKLLVDKYPLLPLKLLIVGGGTMDKELNNILQELKLTEKSILTGYVMPDKIPALQNELDIYAALTNTKESFGVSVLEASACEKPVVVSNMGGLPEVVENRITGIIVPPDNAAAAADAIERLILDPALREKLGKNGRERVKKLYNWNDNVEQMINCYGDVMDGGVLE